MNGYVILAIEKRLINGCRIALLFEPHSEDFATLPLLWNVGGICFEDQKVSSLLRRQLGDDTWLESWCDDGVSDNSTNESGYVMIDCV
jgi:hypothetical protein